MLPFETLYFRKSSLKSVPDTPIEHIRVNTRIIIIALFRMTSSLMTSFDENGIKPVGDRKQLVLLGIIACS